VHDYFNINDLASLCRPCLVNSAAALALAIVSVTDNSHLPDVFNADNSVLNMIFPLCVSVCTNIYMILCCPAQNVTLYFFQKVCYNFSNGKYRKGKLD
jgi:hypothetical protein